MKFCVRKSRFLHQNLSKLFSFRGFGLDPAGGAYSSPQTSILADGEGARCAAPLQEPHPRIGRSSHVTSVPPTLKSWLRHCSTMA